LNLPVWPYSLEVYANAVATIGGGEVVAKLVSQLEKVGSLTLGSGKTRSLARPITDSSKVRSQQHKDGRSHAALPARQRDLLQSKSRFIVVQISQFSHYQVSNKPHYPPTWSSQAPAAARATTVFVLSKRPVLAASNLR
jgi:hypothetical protein